MHKLWPNLNGPACEAMKLRKATACTTDKAHYSTRYVQLSVRQAIGNCKLVGAVMLPAHAAGGLLLLLLLLLLL
jgi:hypothetical protein